MLAGYLKCAEAAHIRRDISAQDAEHAKAEEQRWVAARMSARMLWGEPHVCSPCGVPPLSAAAGSPPMGWCTRRRVIDEVLRLTEQGLPIPAHLLPPPKEEKPKKEVGGKKKK